MASIVSKKQQKQALLKVEVEEEEEEINRFPPLSPLSQYINSSALSIPIIGVYELEVPISRSQTFDFLRDVFIPIHSRFSSIVIRDKKGIQRWKRVEVVIDDHIFIPTFPTGLSTLDYDDILEEYLSKIILEPQPDTRPLWEVHVFMYPTSNAKGTLIFKINHAIGDGYSLMAALFSIHKRADDPTLPLTFPDVAPRMPKDISKWKKIKGLMSLCLNTFTDSAWSVLQGTIMEDGKTAIRSAKPGVEFEPISVQTVVFSLDELRKIQSKVGGTVNEVITGVISYAIQLYMNKIGNVSNGERMTAIVVMNARMLKGFQTVGDMLKANIWGNHFSFLHVMLPSKCKDLKNMDPMDFVVQAKDEMRRRRNSMALYLTKRILGIFRKIRGPDAAARHVYSIWNNTSVTMSSLVGPTQKMVIADHPINSFYFTLAGVPQSLVFTIVSYMGKLRVVVRTEKAFINCRLFVSCMNEAYENIREAASGMDTMKKSN
ncbi:wax ester synthase/diacylglycerol acyltransferase 11-like [Macadamia integrifolia]|uniref:wax ester synthase/diacylglycerol acyltransferase 11-like n=1 Tax=Macadamia integrifolia TaxID=60698 RepID=UPI001C4EAE0A|nr:wax ester synthase/diacylglycerol acyltransferase 11-like [Macadamia integrifolia]